MEFAVTAKKCIHFSRQVAAEPGSLLPMVAAPLIAQSARGGEQVESMRHPPQG